MNKNQYRTLPPLPGGSDKYLNTVDNMLNYLSGEVNRTREEFTEWIISEYSVSRTTVGNSIQSLARLNLIETRPHRRLAVISDGEDVIKATNPETKAKIILKNLLPRYIAASSILLMIARAESALSLEEITEELITEYPRWSSGEAISKRLYWLSALGCVQQTGYRRIYDITAFGREILERFEPEIESTDIEPRTLSERLVKQIRWSAQHTDDPSQFEIAVGNVLEFVGYRVTHHGGPGETDLVVSALLGTETYRFIVDTKSRANGKLHDIDVLTLHSHRRAAHADYAIVVAEQFTGNKIQRYAAENDIALLPIRTLERWIEQHSETPLNLLTYRTIVEQTGLIRELPEAVVKAALTHKKRVRLLYRIIALFQRSYEIKSDIEWTPQQLHSNLAMEYHSERYSQSEVNEAIVFLSNPIIDAVMDSDNGLILGMQHSTLSDQLARLSNSLNPKDKVK